MAGLVLLLGDTGLAFTTGATLQSSNSRSLEMFASSRCAGTDKIYFGNKIDVQYAAPRHASKRMQPGGVRQLSALGGGAALKSTLRKYGLTAVVTHVTQWGAWMLLFFSALSYVSSRTNTLACFLEDVEPGGFWCSSSEHSTDLKRQKSRTVFD